MGRVDADLFSFQDPCSIDEGGKRFHFSLGGYQGGFQVFGLRAVGGVGKYRLIVRDVDVEDGIAHRAVKFGWREIKETDDRSNGCPLREGVVHQI